MKLEELGDYLKNNNIQLDDLVAKLSISDSDISGGRQIVSAKSNQLFTGRFEEQDIRAFKRIWEQYSGDKPMLLKSQLIQTCNSMARNYHGEVCPIEAMLYTSNIISSRFSNFKLVEAVAEVVYLVWRENNEFISSIEHITNVWRWDHVINICAVAVGMICADVPDDDPAVRLLHNIFDCYRYEEITREGCFRGALDSKKEQFIPDILSVVHDLRGTDADKRIGNLFKKNFFTNFPGYYAQWNKDMFLDSSLYVRELVGKIFADGNKDETLVGRYQKTLSKREKQEIVEEGISRIKSGRGPGIYDAVNMLKLCGSREVSERMYQFLQEEFHKKHSVSLDPIISYFSSINSDAANRYMASIPRENEHYAVCRMALFKQNVVPSDELMAEYLSENRPQQIEDYISGFYGLTDKVKDVRNSTFSYFSKFLSGELDDERIKRAINNYERLIRKYKHLYNAQVGKLFQEFFGYKTELGTVRIKMAEQNSCLSIIEMIIDSSNYKEYEDFLYYVAGQGMEFDSTIAIHAQKILRMGNSDRIRL